ncbi:LHFPL tetraspan subfamily member 3 protein-like isoform X1 [Haliotis rubra]|uniref:LHFPL tetraspan subfamily member 3 protein-like isoform X1 n=1 Tax=Haliotis rubra TaxID=36100 RepID=UPI001EE5BDEF|nr:LHFPL tetraspan subfamily member 3 protein-like isoform X1 [Haliotis rubra]
MDREIEYSTEVTKIYHTNYVRNSRAVAVLWAIFTICFAILNIVAFIQPQWIGDTGESNKAGFFGLYQACEENTGANDFECTGDFIQFDTILNGSFRAAAFFVGASALLFLICCLCLILFLFLNTATVLRICGWLQVIGALFLILGCIVYPNGFDSRLVQDICSNSGSYDIGTCGIRWAYILAIVLIFDAVILATLAFVLAAKQAKLLPEVYGKKEKSELNGFASDTLSKRSGFPPLSEDRYSEYSHRSEKSKRSNHSSRIV